MSSALPSIALDRRSVASVSVYPCVLYGQLGLVLLGLSNLGNMFNSTRTRDKS